MTGVLPNPERFYLLTNKMHFYYTDHVRVNRKQVRVFLLVVFALFLFVQTRLVPLYAQQPTGDNQTSDEIQSDLSVDLDLAQKNPVPEQKAILSVETVQAQIVTTTGDTITLKPQDIVAPEAKKESANNAINPEQTTSEQVVTKRETIEVNDSGTPVLTNPIVPENQQSSLPSDSQATTQPGNLVPGTTVLEPDDNAASADNSTNPNFPAPTSSVQQQSTGNGAIQKNTLQPTQSSQPSSNQQSQQTDQATQPSRQPSSADTTQNSDQGNTIPLENGTSAQTQPSDSNADTSAPASSNETSGGSQSSSDTNNSNADQGVVQGASTGPGIFKRIMNKIVNIFGGK